MITIIVACSLIVCCILFALLLWIRRRRNDAVDQTQSMHDFGTVENTPANVSVRSDTSIGAYDVVPTLRGDQNAFVTQQDHEYSSLQMRTSSNPLDGQYVAAPAASNPIDGQYVAAPRASQQQTMQYDAAPTLARTSEYNAPSSKLIS